MAEKENFDDYRRSVTALGVGNEVMSKENLIKLLRENITEFNNFRQENPKILINVPEADLFGANIAGANLEDVILKDANLMNANLNGARLMNTKMKGTIFNRAKLRGCNIQNAIFDNMTDFRDADIDVITIQNLMGSNWTEVDKEKWDEYTLNIIKKEFNDSN